MSYIDCGFAPYWHTIYEQFLLPAFTVTVREEQYPSKHWLENDPSAILGRENYGRDHLRTLHRLVTSQQHEPKAPWEKPTRLNDTSLEADVYKSVKTMIRTDDRNNEHFIPLTKNIQESTNLVVRFLDELLSKQSIPVVDMSDLLGGWSKFLNIISMFS